MKRCSTIKENQTCNEYVDFILLNGVKAFLFSCIWQFNFSDFQSPYGNWEQIMFFLLCSESSKAPGAAGTFCTIFIPTGSLCAPGWAQQLSYPAPWAQLLVKMLSALSLRSFVWCVASACSITAFCDLCPVFPTPLHVLCLSAMDMVEVVESLSLASFLPCTRISGRFTALRTVCLEWLESNLNLKKNHLEC